VCPVIYINCVQHTLGVLIFRYTFYCIEICNCVLQHVHSERSVCVFHNSYISIDSLPFDFENSRQSQYHEHITDGHKTYLQAGELVSVLIHFVNGSIQSFPVLKEVVLELSL
jgi:hypothetical protein